MAKLQTSGSANNHIEAQGTYAAFASLGLISCMVVTLVGIKIWWFKHRLSFDHSSTSNGAAGGNQPRVAVRNRSSKDKRFTEQFREPVVVHGIFRKREEDEIEAFERPKQLPPVRPAKLSKSKSLTSLFRPPSALKEDIDNEVLTIPAPPLRDPPFPPTEETRPMPPRTLSIQKPQTLSITPMTLPPIKIKTPDIQVVPATPTETVGAREEIFKKIPSAIEHQTLQQQMATTPMSDTEEPPLKEIAAAITVHEVQSPATELAPLRALERNISDKSESEEIATRRYKKAKPTIEPFKTGPSLMERRVTGFHAPDDDIWGQVENDSDTELEQSIRYDEAWARTRNDLYFEDEFGKMELKSKTVQFEVNEVDKIQQVDSDGIKTNMMIKQRRPTGYVRNAQTLFLDVDLASDENEVHPSIERELWQEMEKDIDADFSVNIEEEFNKIRHSYEANEEGFLESPIGYGKNIDEDWENFQDLKSHKESNIKERQAIKGWSTQAHLESENVEEQQRVVTFNVEEDDEEEESKTAFVVPRRATGFVRNKLAFKEELWLAEEEETSINTKSILKVNYKLGVNEYENSQCIATEKVSLAEDRPIDYVRASETLELSEGAARESIKEIKHAPLRKAKQRQKVTFQFQTESYSPPATPTDVEASDDDENNDNDYDDDDDDEEKRFSLEMPKPMQRMTKTRYTLDSDKTNQMEPTPSPRAKNTAALLFSTQVSAEYADATEEERSTGGGFNDNDSWSAIRKHRNLTEEFQQITTTVSEIDSTLPRPAPKAAYRNPLAQMTMTTTTDSMAQEESTEEYVKPRTMRDMKKAQSRRTGSLQLEEHTVSTAEA